MAYVPLTRVRTIEGVYLTSFDPKSIIVSDDCLHEINRLRSTFREDLPLHDIPEIAISKKKKVDGWLAQLPRLHLKLFELLRKAQKQVTKTKCSWTIKKTAKKRRVQERPPQTTWPNCRFDNVDEQWQRHWLGQQYSGPYGRCLGSSTTVLTRPDKRSIKHIQGDDNCLLRSFSYLLTDRKTTISWCVQEITCVPLVVCLVLFWIRSSEKFKHEKQFRVRHRYWNLHVCTHVSDKCVPVLWITRQLGIVLAHLYHPVDHYDVVCSVEKIWFYLHCLFSHTGHLYPLELVLCTGSLMDYVSPNLILVITINTKIVDSRTNVCNRVKSGQQCDSSSLYVTEYNSVEIK